MNIQAINFSFSNHKNHQTGVASANKVMTYPNLQPLVQDTVSFSGTDKLAQKVKDVSKAKVLERWNTNGKNFDEIVELTEKFKKPLAKFTWDLERAMKKLIITEKNPDNIIMPGKRGIKSRVKNPKATAEKANSRKLFTIKEIETMGDVGGARIVLRIKNADNVLTALQDIVNQGYRIKEIENYRANPKDSYISQKALDKFEEYCKKHEQYPLVTSRSLPNNYTAAHVTIELPEGEVIELQIMDRDVEAVKDVEDFFYKYRCNRYIDEKYTPIKKLLKKLMPKLDDFQNETHSRYIKDSYDYARHIPARSAKIKFNPEKEFLPFPYSLPQELSFVNIFKMMEECQ